MVAADSPSSIPSFVAGCNELLDAMQADVRDTIRAGERSGETVVAAMEERLRHCEWVLFEDSSHMPHIEEPERFLAVVEGFLARTETH